MRKCVFILTIFGITSLTSAQEDSIFKKIGFDSKNQINYKSKSQDFSYSTILGTKLLLKNFEFRLYEKIPTSNFSQQPNFTTPYFGINFSPINNLKIKVGNINFTGIVPKLNSPTFSTTISPLSSKILSTQNNTISLPNSSSLKENISTSIEYKFSNKKTLLKQTHINLSYMNNSTYIFSGKLNFYNTPQTRFSFSSTVGLFPLEKEKIQKSLKNDKYNCENIFSSLLQLGTNTKYYDGILSFNYYNPIQENPYYSFSSQNKFKINNFILYIYGFYTPYEKFITTSSKTLSTYSQLKINPQITFYKDKIFKLRIGCDFLFEEKDELLAKYGISSNFQTIKTLSKINFVSSNINFKENDCFKKAKYKFSASTNIYNSHSPYFSTSFEIENIDIPQKTTSITSFGTYFFITKNKLLKFSAGIDITTKNKEVTKLQPEAKINYTLKNKNINLNLSLCLASNISFLK